MPLGRQLAAAATGDAAAPLDQAARQAWSAARAAHPGLTVDAPTFFEYVAARLPEGADPAEAMRSLEAADLYLACACARGDAAAIERFEQQFMGRVDAYLARDRSLVSMSDEIKQTLRVRLLVASGEVVPRIGQYTGRGPLGAWLWMTIARIAVDLRRPQRAVDAADVLAERTAVPDPELGYFKQRYGREFRETYREVLASLPAREAALLRLHFVEGVAAEQVGRLYGVSRWTASRWIATTCRHVLRETRKRLAQRLGVPDEQLDSLIALVRSELALSLHDALET